MKKAFLTVSAVFLMYFAFCASCLVLMGCEQAASVIEKTKVIAAEKPSTPGYDERMTAFACASAKMLRAGTKTGRAITPGDPILAYCVAPGWVYLFYEDGAVIGYEPFPDNVSVLHAAAVYEVSLHNREYPDAPWDYIAVPMPVVGPDTSHDPVMGVWQVALVLDDGSIAQGPYTAETEAEWNIWKSGTARTQLDTYNATHDDDAHLVWGPDA